jgi:hypothetical protein
MNDRARSIRATARVEIAQAQAVEDVTPNPNRITSHANTTWTLFFRTACCDIVRSLQVLPMTTAMSPVCPTCHVTTMIRIRPDEVITGPLPWETTSGD